MTLPSYQLLYGATAKGAAEAAPRDTDHLRVYSRFGVSVGLYQRRYRASAAPQMPVA